MRTLARRLFVAASIVFAIFFLYDGITGPHGHDRGGVLIGFGMILACALAIGSIAAWLIAFVSGRGRAR
ncbi:MAG TPA: hypothetical protein VF824_17330 [Thermoanaerobaculia bacterium]|jgi:hypothetical protein